MTDLLNKTISRGMFSIKRSELCNQYLLKEPENDIINMMEDRFICSIEVMSAVLNGKYSDIYLYGINVPKDKVDPDHYLPDYGKLRRIMYNFYSGCSIIISDEYGRSCNYKELPLSEAIKIYNVVLELLAYNDDSLYAKYTIDDRSLWEDKCNRLHMNPSTKNPVIGLNKVYDEDYEDRSEDFRYRSYLSTGGILTKEDWRTNMSGKTNYPAYRFDGKNVKWATKLNNSKEKKYDKTTFILFLVIAFLLLIITGSLILSFIILVIGGLLSKDYLKNEIIKAFSSSKSSKRTVRKNSKKR